MLSFIAWLFVVSLFMAFWFCNERSLRGRENGIRLLLLGALTGTVFGAAFPMQSASAQEPIPATPAVSNFEWLEPRGLSVVDLVGLVPEEDLRDAIVTFTGGAGILQYMEGKRDGQDVTIKVKVSPRYPQPGLGTTTINCLGKRALHDEWPIIVPPSRMRVFDGGRDVTAQVFAVWYYLDGQRLPSRNASDPAGRYFGDEQRVGPAFEEGELLLPGNSGCTIFLAGEYRDLTAEFRFEVENKIRITSLGYATYRFGNYVGVGEAGMLRPLQEQLIGEFGARHDKFRLWPPPGADYVFVKYPPTPVSPYSGPFVENISLPSSGTYRLANGNSDLSVDHTVSMGMPYLGQWLDADIERPVNIDPDEKRPVGVDYLVPLPAIDTLTAPEYFVPEGIEFDSCMLRGDCSLEFLHDMFNKEMEMTIYYYAVERIGVGLDRIPLRQVGREWQPGDNVAAVGAPAALDTMTLPPTIFFPIVFSLPISPDDPTGCPCGWFAEDGRMLDFIPSPQAGAMK